VSGKLTDVAPQNANPSVPACLPAPASAAPTPACNSSVHAPNEGPERFPTVGPSGCSELAPAAVTVH